ncbi:riboflavin synthase alpha chain [Ekhidna lutea]|uniref:Riboflavin synthase n=1 Tax=Ekhidna lutea TaxID=447679 RepID=A0A239M9R4_EKHLU|nr:riboflavin synthase [Ekhidna lutea]SNT38788.1 riboflavin synthase alpha chain [Ekhidna lutea]
MFTGIIETVGKVQEISKNGTNVDFEIASEISGELKIDQSVSHNGVCLTVTKVGDGKHWVTAIDETLKISNIGALAKGDEINLERCMKADGRFDGHIVQGHVDTTAEVKSIKDENGSWLITFELDQKGLVVEKGSICINGTSLTCFNVDEKTFSVAIIPYTFEYTNFKKLEVGSTVNIEFDIIGKYINLIVNKK